MAIFFLLGVIPNLWLSVRYPSLILWPFTPLEILNQRLDDRVDDMAKVSETFVTDPWRC